MYCISGTNLALSDCNTWGMHDKNYLISGNIVATQTSRSSLDGRVSSRELEGMNTGFRTRPDGNRDQREGINGTGCYFLTCGQH
jgi:hypothetical protein